MNHSEKSGLFMRDSATEDRLTGGLLKSRRWSDNVEPRVR